MRGYIAKVQIPILENKGRDAQRRPDFGIEEYRKIYRALRTWVHGGRAGKSRDMREFPRDYVLILTNTGMRHGTEAQNLRWKNISTFEMDGRTYLEMYAKGKTKARKLIAGRSCLIYLKRIHARFRGIADVPFDFVKMPRR
jgi:hypothetical protein